MSDDLDAAPRRSRRRTWALILAVAIVGAAIAWYALGVGLEPRPPPDPTNGVELVPGTDRTVPAH